MPHYKTGDQIIGHHNKDTNNIPIKKINGKLFNNKMGDHKNINTE